MKRFTALFDLVHIAQTAPKWLVFNTQTTAPLTPITAVICIEKITSSHLLHFASTTRLAQETQPVDPSSSDCLRSMLLNSFRRNDFLSDEDVNQRLQGLHILLRQEIVVHRDSGEVNEATVQF